MWFKNSSTSSPTGLLIILGIIVVFIPVIFVFIQEPSIQKEREVSLPLEKEAPQKEIQIPRGEGVVPNIEARDGRRINDIRIIKVILGEYYDSYNVYPNSLSELVPEFLNDLPKDPKTNQDYFYAFYPFIEPSCYHLGTVLENVNRYELLNDADFDSKMAGYINGFNGIDPVYDIEERKIEKPETKLEEEESESGIRNFHLSEIIFNDLPDSIEGYSCASCEGYYNYVCPKGYHRTDCEYSQSGSHGCCSSCIVVKIKCVED